METCKHEPLLEFRVDDPVGESLSADTDTLKYTVALQLVENQSGLNHTCKCSNNILFQFLAAQDPPRTCCEARFYKVHTFSENHIRCAYEIIISSVSSQSIYYTWYLYTEIALSRYKPDYYSTEWCRTLSPSCGEAKRLMAYNG